MNPKSYGAWYHRKWVIQFGLSPMDAEFLLLKKLLKLDARNFHGWDYRRYLSLHSTLYRRNSFLVTVISLVTVVNPVYLSIAFFVLISRAVFRSMVHSIKFLLDHFSQICCKD